MKKVLVIDDEQSIIIYLSTLLEDNGYLPLTAMDAEEGAQVAHAEHPDLICMDIMMPNLNGQEALKKIREIEREEGIQETHEVKVIMTTALCDPKSITEAFYKGGASSYIVKPISEEKLYEKMRKFSLIK